MPAPVQTAAATSKQLRDYESHLSIKNLGITSYFKTAAGGGELGVASGFGFAANVLIEFLSTSSRLLFHNISNTVSTGGWGLQLNGSNDLVAYVRVAGGQVISNAIRLTNVNVGQILTVVGRFNGTALDLTLARVTSVPVAVAGTYATPAGGASWSGFTNALSQDSPIGVRELAALTFRGVPSEQQMQSLFEAARAVGDLPKDFPVAMPVIYGARIPASGAAGHYLSTPGGVRGGHASGTWVGIWGTISSLLGNEALISTTANSAGGYVAQREGNRFVVGRRSSGTYDQVLTYTFKESDIGRRMLFGLSHDGTTLRGWIDGVEVGSLVCAPIMAPTAAPMSIATTWSAYPTQLIPAPNFTALGVVGGDGSVLTAGEWITLNADTVANGAIGTVAGKATHRWNIWGAILANSGTMPASVPDTIGTDHLTVTGTVVAAATGAVTSHHWSLKRALAGTTVTDGQAAPATIADTITAAPADDLTKTGTSTVSKIWRSANGKKRDGVLGHTNTSYYQSAAGAGIRGAPGGFWFFLAPRIDSISVAGNDAYQGVCGAMAANQATGYMLWFDGNNLRFCVGNGGGAIHTPTLAFVAAAADVGQRVPILCRLNGSTAELWVRGVAVGTANVTIGYSPAGIAVPMELGRVSITSPAVFNSSKLTHYGLMGGDVAISNAEVAAVFAEFAATERMIGPAGKTQHYYDIPRDSLLSGGTKAPAQVLDRAGTDHLTNTSISVNTLGGTGAVVLSKATSAGSTSTVRLTTAGTAGIAGVSSGFWAGCLIRDDLLTNYPRALFGRTNMSSAGWWMYLSNPNNQLTVGLGNGSSMINAVGGLVPTGQYVDCRFVYDGTNLTVYKNGVAGTPVPVAGYVAHALYMSIGAANVGSYQANDIGFYGAGGGHSVPTPAEILTAATASLAQGKFVTIAAKTSHHYSAVDDIADAGGIAPSVYLERIAGVEHLHVSAPALQLSRRTDRLYALDRDHLGRAKPIETGLKNFTTTSVLRTANGGGTAGSYAGGIWWAGLFKYLSTTGVSGSIIGRCGISTLSGYEFYMSGGTLLFVRVVGATDWVNGPMMTFTAADVGKLFFIGGWIDPIAGSLRGFARRAQIGSGVACTAYQVPTTRPFFIGGRTEAAGGTIQNAVPNFASYGAMCGQGVPSIAEWQYAHDASVAGEEIVALPGARTEHLWNIKRDYIEAGNAMPTQILDRIGTDHMSIAGTDLTIEHQYARLWAA